jgi:hypothetical protein
MDHSISFWLVVDDFALDDLGRSGVDGGLLGGVGGASAVHVGFGLLGWGQVPVVAREGREGNGPGLCGERHLSTPDLGNLDAGVLIEDRTRAGGGASTRQIATDELLAKLEKDALAATGQAGEDRARRPFMHTDPPHPCALPRPRRTGGAGQPLPTAGAAPRETMPVSCGVRKPHENGRLTEDEIVEKAATGACEARTAGLTGLSAVGPGQLI